jgi:uncharacterized protein (TIGR02099 family)
MAKTHPYFHKLKSVIGYSVATFVILIALSVSGLRFLLTTVDLYQNEVEELASALLEQPVKIGRMDAKLSGLVPTLIFHDVQLLSEKTKRPLFALSRIDVGISFQMLLLKQEIIPTQLTVRGMKLSVTRTVEGKLKFEGLDLEGLTSPAEGDHDVNTFLERWFLLRSEIAVEDSSIIWEDEKNAGLRWVFDDVNFVLKNSDIHHQLSFSGKLPEALGDKVKLDFDVVGDITQPSTWKAKLYVESKNINLKTLQTYIQYKKLKLNSGSVALNLWADWDKGEVKQLSGDVKLYDFSYNYENNKKVSLDLVSAVFDANKDLQNYWNVSVDKFNYKSAGKIWPESKFSLALNYQKGNIDDIYIKSDYLKLGEIAKIIGEHHLLKPEDSKKLNNLNIRGEVSDFQIAWKENKLYKIKADFSGCAINAWEKLPAAKNLSGTIVFENNNGAISLSSKNSILSFPRLFRNEFKLDNLSADIQVVHSSEGLLFNVNRLLTENAEVSAVSSATLLIPGNNSSPFLDLQTHVLRGNAEKVSHYLPVTIMQKTLVSWLDHGFVAGQVNNGTIIFNGKLNDFPFKKNEGVFSVDVDTSNLTINYQDGWPVIENANIKGVFSSQGMKLHLFKAEVKKNKLADSYAQITNFSDAELQLSIIANGSTHDAVEYLVNSPILPAAKNVVESLRFVGNVETKISVNIPLSASLKEQKIISYSGSAALANNSLYMLNDKLDVTEIDGNISFDEKIISSDAIVAKILGHEAKISVITQGGNKDIKISATSEAEPGVILKRFDIPGAKNISGQTSYSGDLIFPGKNSTRHKPVLTIASDLRGVESLFPEFLLKTKNTKQDFIFKTVFEPEDKTHFEFYFNKKGSAVLELAKSAQGETYLNKAAISISDNQAILPGKNILYVDGVINEFTPSKWLDALELNDKNKSQSFFVNPVVLNLDELKVFTVSDEITKAQTFYSNPAFLPTFEGIIKKLYLDDIFLGRLDFKSSQKKYGMHLDELILSAQNMKLVANGDWRYNRGKQKTEVDVTLSSNDFGGMLNDLGFSAIIQSGVAQTVGKLYWQGTPSQFSLKKLNGAVQLNIENGNILDVDAGSGRLLGFFSLAALPRKLLGDFKGSFESGFSFDKAKGQLRIENGDVYTDKFEVSSPVAEITVSGRTGLAARDYENTVELIPHVGEGVTGLVALLINLPAGIGLWLMDKMTGEQFNEASARIYKISGSWAKPEIKLIKQE